MGGRGSTVGSGRYTRITFVTSGTQTGGGSGAVNQQATNVANQAPTQNNTPVIPDAVKKLSQMSDDDMAKLYNKSKRVDMPNHLKDMSDKTQKFVYMAGINEKPQVLDKKSFNKYLKDNNIPRSDILARSVGGASYSVNGVQINLSPQQVTGMIKDSDLTYVGGKRGGQLSGAGTYFDMNGGRNTGYSSGATCIGVLSKKANIIDRSTLGNRVSSFQRSHPKFAKAVGHYNNDTMSIYALAMGYNVIRNGSYHNVIDRAALVMRAEDL